MHPCSNFPKYFRNCFCCQNSHFLFFFPLAPLSLTPDLPDGSACEHLEALLSAAADAVQQEDNRCGATTSRSPDISLPLTLVGFSKGVIVLNQLVTELACSPPPAAPAAPALSETNSSTSSDVSGDGIKLNRKRSRVSMSHSSRCGSSCGGGGGERLASSEGDLTNPPSPADDGDLGATMASSNWPMAWEDGRDEERREDGRNTGNGTPHAGVQGGYKPHQVRTSTESGWNSSIYADIQLRDGWIFWGKVSSRPTQVVICIVCLEVFASAILTSLCWNLVYQGWDILLGRVNLLSYPRMHAHSNSRGSTCLMCRRSS